MIKDILYVMIIVMKLILNVFWIAIIVAISVIRVNVNVIMG